MVALVGNADEHSCMSSVEEKECQSDCSFCDSANRSISLASSKRSHDDKENQSVRQSIKRLKLSDSKENEVLLQSKGRMVRLSGLASELGLSRAEDHKEPLRDITNI